MITRKVKHRLIIQFHQIMENSTRDNRLPVLSRKLDTWNKNASIMTIKKEKIIMSVEAVKRIMTVVNAKLCDRLELNLYS